MAVIFAGVVPGKEDLQTSYIDEKHCSTENMPGWVGGDADGRDGVGGVVVNCFYHRECGEVIGFGV